MKKRIIIAGSRNYNNYEYVKETLDLVLNDLMNEDIEIICGDARGVDMLGKRYADEHSIPVIHFPADWDKYGRSAGVIRNAEMAKYAAKTYGILIAFWDGESRGTKNMIETASKYGLYICEYRV